MDVAGFEPANYLLIRLVGPVGIEPTCDQTTLSTAYQAEGLRPRNPAMLSGMAGYKDAILALRAQKTSYREIARQLGCSKGTVAYHCSRLEDHDQIVEDNRKHLATTRQIPQVKASLLNWLLVDGVRRTDVADALNMDYKEVLAHARRKGLQKRPEKLTQYRYVLRRRRHLKMLAVARKGGRCVRCGYHRSLRALTFHHPDPEAKDFSVSANSNRSWLAVRTEIDKCVLLCANCHREEHDVRDMWAPPPVFPSD